MEHIAIEGVIGAGKTTVARLVADQTNSIFIGEAAETHPFLDAFYTDPARYALETELGFLLIHYHQLFHRGPIPTVTDFCLAKDLVFARMNLGGNDLDIFERLFTHLSHRVASPDHVFFLRLPIPICIKRIKMRGVPREQSIAEPYLTALEEAYIQHAQQLGQDVDILNVEEDVSADAIANLILERL